MNNLINILKKYEGKEIGTWDGGNDSGSIDFIDNIDDNVSDWLYDIINDKLNYGGWAGDFHSCGIIKIKDNTIILEGEDIDNDLVVADIPPLVYKLNIPEDIKYLDSVTVYINTQDHDADGYVVYIGYNIQHGYISQAVKDFVKDTEQKIKNLIDSDYNETIKIFSGTISMDQEEIEINHYLRPDPNAISYEIPFAELL